MAETFSNGEVKLSIRSKINRNALEQTANTQALETLNGQMAQILSRVAALEASEGGTPDTPTVDGALTTFPFHYVDIFNYTHQTTGSSGQKFSKAATIAGYKGSGYAQLNSTSAVAGTNAIAYVDEFAPNASDPNVQVARKVWLRVRGAQGATIAGRSFNGGSLGTITLTQTNVWHWLQVPTTHNPYDNQYQLHGRSGSVQIDGIVVTSQSNTTTPTGTNGFRTS